MSSSPTAAATLRGIAEAEAGESFVSWVLAGYGEDFRPALRPADITPGEKHHCFRNAFRLARERRELRYVEGLALPRGWENFPNRHGWCVDPAGAVIDPTPTWSESARTLPAALLGVVIDLDLAEPFVERSEPTRGALHALAEAPEKLIAELDARRRAERTR